jgi:hypothetical protein
MRPEVVLPLAAVLLTSTVQVPTPPWEKVPV